MEFHTSYLCKKCNSMQSAISVNVHLMVCKYATSTYLYSGENHIRIHVDKQYWILLNLDNIIKMLPTIILFDLDYWNIFKGFVHVDKLILKKFDIMVEDFISTEDILNVFRAQSVSCSNCGYFYDCFPSLQIAEAHIVAEQPAAARLSSTDASLAPD